MCVCKFIECVCFNVSHSVFGKYKLEKLKEVLANERGKGRREIAESQFKMLTIQFSVAIKTSAKFYVMVKFN